MPASVLEVEIVAIVEDVVQFPAVALLFKVFLYALARCLARGCRFLAGLTLQVLQHMLDVEVIVAVIQNVRLIVVVEFALF